MEQRLSVLFLLAALVPLALSATRIFFLVNQELTWSEARAYCQAHYIDLVSIKSSLDAPVIQYLFTAYNLASGAWIGLYNDRKHWKWSMDDSLLGNFTSWDLDNFEPDNSGGNEMCVLMSSNGWWDSYCAFSIPFMCYDGTKIGTDRYVLIPDNKNWTEAQSICRANYTDLVSIPDAAEYATILSLIYGDTWIGLYKDSWKWTDETNTYPINWALDQPDNFYGDENCGSILDGLVADESCTDNRTFLCYTYPNLRKIIQLKVESDQDVNDPAVKAAILEEIKQKLIMLGLPQIKMTWKIHQDGDVFKKLV